VQIWADAAGSDAATVGPLKLLQLPLAPPPADATVHRTLVSRQPLITIRGLAPGSYKVRVGGRDVGEGSAADLAQGVRVAAGPAADLAQQLVAAVNEKNWEFYMKYRAVNGEYIYGRRKEPFGVVNFPKEFELQEKLVAEQDGKIHELAGVPGPLNVEVVKADR
jgi:hypothetical protein